MGSVAHPLGLPSLFGTLLSDLLKVAMALYVIHINHSSASQGQAGIPPCAG